MKLIISGSRSITDYNRVFELIDNFVAVNGRPTTVICGGSYGVDTYGEWWARNNRIKVRKMLPDWNEYGKSAGFRANKDMAQVADAALVIWDGISKGSGSMIDNMRKLSKPCRIIMYNELK
jgi:hypothetical protein